MSDDLELKWEGEMLIENDDDDALNYVLNQPVVPTEPVPEALTTEHGPRDEMRRSGVTLALQAARTAGSDWTHLLRHPDCFRARLTVHDDIRTVYGNVWRYAHEGISVMERRLSSITRLSVSFKFVDMPLANGDHERQFVTDCARRIRDAVAHGTDGIPPAALVCFVLRQTYKDRHVPELWLHWPGLAVTSKDFTSAWCREQLGRCPGQWRDGGWSVQARNTESHVPMYGCAVADGELPMLVVALVDAAGTMHTDWREWLLRNDCSAAWYVGHTHRWPPPLGLAGRLERLLPLICSINPMGTPCRALGAPPALGDADPQEEGVSRILRHLSAARRSSVRRSNEVGQLLYMLSGGAAWAERKWIVWCTNCATFADVPALSAGELGHQWQTFGGGDGDADVWGALYEMVRQDVDADTYTAFLQAQREADHPNRGGGGATEGRGLLGQLGSATHYDLAQYVRHALRTVAVCTSVSGHGVWYVYHRKRHRWQFDPEGADVLVWSLGMLSDQVQALRAAVNVAGTPGAAPGNPRGGGTRMPFPRLANFPDEAREEQDVARAILVHLDTVIGDVRHMQSVVRYLGKLQCSRTFAEQLDVKHEHLVPFANGVLDLDQLVLRPGEPGDMVMRGPTYEWRDYGETDADSEEMERMLTQIFTDVEVRRFFCEAGATWMRRRNRFKHFCTAASLLAHTEATGRTCSQATRTVGRACSSRWSSWPSLPCVDSSRSRPSRARTRTRQHTVIILHGHMDKPSVCATSRIPPRRCLWPTR